VHRAPLTTVCLLLVTATAWLTAGEEVLPIDSETRWLGTSLDLHDDVFLPAYGYTFPPFDTGSDPARILRTVTPQTFVRFYTPGISGPLGAWATSASEVRGLTPEQVWDRLALPQSVPPTHVAMLMGPTSDIAPGTDDNGTWLIGGFAGAFTYTEGAFSRYLSGGAYQYFLLGPGKPPGMVATLTGPEYGVPAVVFTGYTTSLILNANGTSNQGRSLVGDLPVFSYLFSTNQTPGSENTRTLATALDRLNAPPGSALYSALYQPLDILWIRGQDAELTAALERINPEGYGAVPLSRLLGTAGWLDAMESDGAGDERDREDHSWHLWSSADGRVSRFDGWRSAEGRALVGADRRWAADWRAGALLGGGVAQTDWAADGRAESTNLNLGLYARYQPFDGFCFSMAALGGVGWVESRRRFSLLDEPLLAGVTPFGALAFLPDPRMPHAKFEAFDAAAHVALGYRAHLGRVCLTPRLQIDGLFSHIPEFTESGGGALNVSYEDLGGQALRVRADLTASFPLSSGRAGGFEPWLRAGAARYEELGEPEFRAHFGEGGRFTVNRASLDRTSGTGAVGVRWHSEKWTVTGQAEGEWGGIESYGGRLTIQRRF
jgi:hypothetical protein